MRDRSDATTARVLRQCDPSLERECGRSRKSGAWSAARQLAAPSEPEEGVRLAAACASVLSPRWRLVGVVVAVALCRLVV